MPRPRGPKRRPRVDSRDDRPGGRSFPRSWPASSAGAPSSVPPRAPADYDLPPPSARWNLLFTGLAVTGVSYGLALGASYAWPDERISSELRIPIVGPWMAIANTGCSDKDPDCSTVTLVFTAVLMGMDGVLQAGGLGLALESVFMTDGSAEIPLEHAADAAPGAVRRGKRRDGARPRRYVLRRRGVVLVPTEHFETFRVAEEMAISRGDRERSVDRRARTREW